MRLHRPVGDETAACYGDYLSPAEVKQLAEGDVLDVLCNDGMNYHVEVKKNDNGETMQANITHRSIDR